MTFDDLKRSYEEKRRTYGSEAYLYVSELLAEAKEEYAQQYLASERAQKKREAGDVPDADQSWRAFKGKNFERLVLYVLEEELTSLGLRCVSGGKLGNARLTKELSTVRRNVAIHYGNYDLLPDVDIVVYQPESFRVVGVISCKITLRERIAQTAYWKLKLAADPVTEHIKVYFVTPDEDGDLIHALRPGGTSRGAKNRILVEHELDGTYVLRPVEESAKVKSFRSLISDVRILLRRRR